MQRTLPWSPLLIGLVAVALAPTARATAPNSADRCIRQFLSRDDAQPAYRAVRHMEAENGSRSGWLEAVTEYSPETGLQYRITAEGGSGYIRNNVLRAVLEGERDAIAKGATARSSIDPSNYSFEASGVNENGLAHIRLTPKRKDHVLVSGSMFLETLDGGLVRLEGRLAKSPSFWIKDVDIVRSYERVGSAVVPVALESKANLRLLGQATLRMTYTYTEIDGQPTPSQP